MTKVEASVPSPSHHDGDDVALQSTFAATLVAWQRTHGRQTLPWQQLGTERTEQRDAYRIWLAEIMLQQTQVAAVVPFYRRFLACFPDVSTLAAAPLDHVMREWAGLGYYSRARNLHATAREVVARYHGRFPDTVEALAALPGIGRSTAGAIAAFAYGRRAPILDGNVRRVLARVFVVEGPPSDSAVVRRLWSLAGSLLQSLPPDDDVARYTQGLMDLGATICTPRRPVCLVCPFASTCGAHRDGREEELPHRAQRRAVPTRRTTLAVVTRGDAVLLLRRPPTGIWGGLWSLPEAPVDADDVSAWARIGAVASVVREGGFVHAFTHFVLDADIVRVRIAEPPTDPNAVASPDETRWVPFDALPSFGLPTPIRALLARVSR